MKVVYMARQKRETITRTTRLIKPIAEAIDKYAENQLISQNAALNQLLKEVLMNKGLLNESDLEDSDSD